MTPKVLSKKKVMPPNVQKVEVRRASARLNCLIERKLPSVKSEGLQDTAKHPIPSDKGLQDSVSRKFLNSLGIQPIEDSFPEYGPHPILNSKVNGGRARVNQLFKNGNEGRARVNQLFKNGNEGNEYNESQKVIKKRQKILENLNTDVDQQVSNQKVANSHSSPINDSSKKTTLEPSIFKGAMSNGGFDQVVGNKPMGNDNSFPTNVSSENPTLEHNQNATDKVGQRVNQNMSNDNTFPTNDGGSEKATTEHIGQTSDNKGTTSKGHKKRGKTHMLEIWGRPSNLPLITLELNEKGIPIEKNASTLAEWLGSVARNGQYCPLDVETWHKMPKQKREELLDLVKARFDITLLDESYILSSVASKWRTYKCYLRSKYWSANHMEYNLEGDDMQISREQWFKLLEHWNTEKSMEMSRKNKIARSKRRMNQATGKQSFANVSKKMEVKNGHKPSRADMFWKCFSRKENKTSEEVSQAWAKMQELQNQLPEGKEDTIAPNDIYAQVLGEDKPGRVRMLGAGISPSDVWGDELKRKPTKQALLLEKAKLVEAQKENADLRAQLQMQQTNSINQNTTCLTQLEVGTFVSLKSISNSTREVAKGYVHSVDATKEVGGRVLGSGWCEVLVIAVLHGQEDLHRPFEFYNKLEDVIGLPIAWPTMLVTPTQRI